MEIQSVQNRAIDPAAAASRVAGSRPAAGTASDGPADRVVVSEQARQLSARLTGAEGPELQLSPERLREMIEQAEEAHTRNR